MIIYLVDIFLDGNLNKMCYYLGLNTKNLTIAKDFFIDNNEILYWRFEFIYLFEFETIINKRFDIKINQKRENGFCRIDPLNVTSETFFTINCSNWIDNDGIKDYSFYGIIN